MYKIYRGEERQANILCLPRTSDASTPVHVSPKFMHASGSGAYADAIMELDWSVGEIFKALERCGVEDNTIVIFTSDNGPDQGSWMGGDHGVSTPLRGNKATTWEGGHRVPCLIYWKGRVEPGTTYSHIATNMDLFPTLATAAGAEVSGSMGLDGEDIISLLERPVSDRVFFYYSTNGKIEAVRCGEWKLHVNKTKGWDKETQGEFEPQLYNLANDASESRNLAYAYPEQVRR